LIPVVVLLTESPFRFRIPIWYELKLLFLAWLALPNFRGAAFIYDRFVRDQLRKHGLTNHPGNGSSSNAMSKKENGTKEKSLSPASKEKENAKSKFLSFVGSSKKDHEKHSTKDS
jgi:receptor expression-enhancing protein 5/6